MSHIAPSRPYAGKKAAIIGGGVIGASWAALFLANGLRVTVSDPDPEVRGKVMDLLASAAPALEALGYQAQNIAAQLTFEKDNARAVADAYVVQESGPERPDFKQATWKVIEAAAPTDALLCSSSSTIPASVQNVQMADRSRLLVGHPFNPPHLMPLVEVVPSPQTDPKITARAVDFYNGMGKVALEIRKEVPGFVANRLQAAIFQEAVFLVASGVVSITQLDDIVTNSLGIRWATSGPFLSFHLGGGPGGLKHFLAHLGPATEAGWRNLGKASLDDATRGLLVRQLDDSYATSSYVELSKIRDEKEIAVIKGIAEAHSAG